MLSFVLHCTRTSSVVGVSRGFPTNYRSIPVFGLLRERGVWSASPGPFSQQLLGSIAAGGKVMGNKAMTFTESQLEDYQDCTFFTRKEILRVYKRYRAICPEVVPKKMTGDEPVKIRVPQERIEQLPELKENPFKERICQVFSKEGNGSLSFEDFLDLLSVFSEQAPRQIKVYYAFKIYDFDDDHHIGPADLEQVLKLLTRSQLSAEEIVQVCEKVIEEADVDGDGKLSFMEFEHVILRAPDFLGTFHIRV